MFYFILIIIWLSCLIMAKNLVEFLLHLGFFKSVGLGEIFPAKLFYVHAK